jgi:iron complex outermembrane receptor protein/vitamin B12 transporter
MLRAHRRLSVLIPFVLLIVFGFGGRASASGPDPRASVVSGAVFDPLGAAVAGASVTLLRDGRAAATSPSDAKGYFEFKNVATGRYELLVKAPGYSPRTLDPFFVGTEATVTLDDVVLSIGVNAQVVVTTAAIEQPASQVGAPVTVVDRDTIDAMAKPDVLDALRTVPGINIVQSGGRGSQTSLFIRGGTSSFNKVLIDGVPANDIGGLFDFGDVAATGVDRVEVLRDANSVIHGSDAIAGVVGLTTTQGRSHTPELSYSGDGGNFGTSRNQLTFGGAVQRFDYFAAYSDFRTDNDVPNSADKNHTFASRFGVVAGSHTVITGTLRWYDTRVGLPNAFAYYGIADDTVKTSQSTLASVSAQSQLSSTWETTLRFSVTHKDYQTENPAPTGELYDPFDSGFPVYLGKLTTITGGNAYSATGQAVLDFSGPYPGLFNSALTRQTLFGQATYRASRMFSLSMGGRAEHESGFTQFFSKAETSRDNGGAFIEARTNTRRLLSSLGLGVEHNAVFGEAVTPRLSVTLYLRTPSARTFGDTKLTVNTGTGIKAPSIDQENSSLFVVLRDAGTPSSSVEPIGAERARNFDVGIDQGLWHSRVRARAAFFDNKFSNLIEFVNSTSLPLLGVPPDVAATVGFGAYVNSSSYRVKGLETSAELAAGQVRVVGSYTFIDAVVTESFSSSALGPVFNPAFPDVAIGAFSPLIGARPFRIPTHAGNVVVMWTHRKLDATVSGYFAGHTDDSTFMSDKDFGNTLLLPNHDLGAAHQKVDLSVAYRIHPRFRWFLSIENVGNEAFQAAPGFPALPRSFRTGVTVKVGGDPVKQP